jgi:hypothetical protein
MLKRILMNQVDASPGNSAGAAPADVPPAQAAPQAQGAPTPAISPEDFTKLVTSVADLAKSVNSLHAADRRTREGKQPAKPDGADGATPIADDPSSQLARRDAFDDATSELKLTKGQRQILRELVDLKKLHPSDVDGFVTDHATRAGWAVSSNATQPSAAPAAASPAMPAQPSNAQPASSRGAPPAPQVPLDEMNVWTMSVADRDAFIAKHGMKKYLEKARHQGKSISIDPRR